MSGRAGLGDTLVLRLDITDQICRHVSIDEFGWHDAKFSDRTSHAHHEIARRQCSSACMEAGGPRVAEDMPLRETRTLRRVRELVRGGLRNEAYFAGVGIELATLPDQLASNLWHTVMFSSVGTMPSFPIVPLTLITRSPAASCRGNLSEVACAMKRTLLGSASSLPPFPINSPRRSDSGKSRRSPR